jgi:hypothetical protein
MCSDDRPRSVRSRLAVGVVAVCALLVPTLHARNAPKAHYFGHVALGGGWNVVFSLVNTGATTVNGTLTLTGQDGSPLDARIDGLVGASFRLEPMPPGGVRRLLAEPLSATDPLRFGWARLENVGESVTITATYLHMQEGVLKTLSSVPSSRMVTSATIPVYNDLAAERFVGFAVANPNASPITLRLVTLNESGTVEDGPVTPGQLILPPNGQTMIFLHEILTNRTTFTGSIVLSAQEAPRRFVATALVQNGPLITAVPVIPEKAPSVSF